MIPRSSAISYITWWIGLDMGTWEPVDNVTNAEALVDALHRKYPEKPSLSSLTPRRFKRGIMS